MWRDLFTPTHLLIMVLVVVVLFGWKKLPDAARSIGRSARIFKSEMSEMKNDGKDAKASPSAADTIRGQVVDQQAQTQAYPTTDPTGTQGAQDRPVDPSTSSTPQSR